MTKKRIKKGRQAHVRGGVQSAPGGRVTIESAEMANAKVTIIFTQKKMYSSLQNVLGLIRKD